MDNFSIKDIFDIVIVAIMLYYLYRIMKESGTINIFYGVMAFIGVWIVASEILHMRLIGSILDKFMSIGLLILVIIFQEQIKRFLLELGSQRRWKFLTAVLHHRRGGSREQDMSLEKVMPLVRACRNMAKTKTGALIVIQRHMSLESYEKTGDAIDATVNARLIENIFFKNSPLHDGALIIADGRLKAAGCILPVSHDADVPRSLGLRHRSALGISQASDALAIVVSEETGRISLASHGRLQLNITDTELERTLSDLSLE